MGRTGIKALAALLAASALSACAQGPADFMSDLTPAQVATTTPQPVRTPADRELLLRDLDAAGDQQASEGRAAVGTLPSAMALSIIRQQQEEEARALLDAAEPVPPAPAPAGDVAACDPATATACPPPVQ